MANEALDISLLTATAGKEHSKIKRLITDNVHRVLGGFTPEKMLQFKRDLLTFEDSQDLAMPYDADLPNFKSIGKITPREVEIKVGMINLKEEFERYRETYLITLRELGITEKKFPFHQWFVETIVIVGLDSLAKLPFQGVHNASGTNTLDICNGIHKITENEVAGGGISVANGNLFEMLAGATDYDNSNIHDNLMAQFNLFPDLVKENGVEIWMPYRYKQTYKEWFKSEYTNVTDGDVPVDYLDGTDKKAKFRWETQMGAKKKVYMTVKGNFVYGIDKENKTFGKLKFWQINPFIVGVVNKIAIGFQIHSINKRIFNVNNLT